jgi:hypothetical protein
LPTAAASMAAAESYEASGRFYGTVVVCMYAVWAIITVAVGQDFYSFNAGSKSVLQRPSWLPAGVLRLLHVPGVCRVAAHLPLPALIVAAWRPDLWACRLAAALALSVFCLVDTSVTHSHRDYANLYCAWLLTVLPHYAHSVALGVSIHYIASSGIAKLWVAGSASAWCAPDTLRGVLQTYSKVRGWLVAVESLG